VPHRQSGYRTAGDTAAARAACGAVKQGLRDPLCRREKSNGLPFAGVLAATAFHPAPGKAGVADKKSVIPWRSVTPLEKPLRTSVCAGRAEGALAFAEVDFRVSASPAPQNAGFANRQAGIAANTFDQEMFFVPAPGRTKSRRVTAPATGQ